MHCPQRARCNWQAVHHASLGVHLSNDCSRVPGAQPAVGPSQSDRSHLGLLRDGRLLAGRRHHEAVQVDADLVQHAVHQLVRLALLVLALVSGRARPSVRIGVG